MRSPNIRSGAHSTFARDILAVASPQGKGLLVTFGVYMDKSGPDDAIPAVTVAGVISTVERWDAFNEEWAEALHDFDELPFFHMSEYESGIGLYEDWQARGVKKERLGRLLGIIEKHVLGTVGASISLADCKAYFGDDPVQTAYGLTATHCFMLLPPFRYVARRPAERIVYTFEQGDQGYGKLEAQYDDMYATPWRREYNRLAGKLVVGRKDFPPLQAADILAYEGWKQWAREHGGETRPTRYPFERLSRSVPSEWATLAPMPLRDLKVPPGAPSIEVLEPDLARVVMPTAQLPKAWG